MIYISVYPNTRAVPRTGDKNPAASSSQNNGVIKKREKYLRNFQAVLVTTGVAMLQGVAPETPTHKMDCAFPVGWGWIPPRSDNQVGREFPHIQAESPPLLAQRCLVV